MTLITDGMPTLAPGCSRMRDPASERCALAKTLQEAALLRQREHAALITLVLSTRYSAVPVHPNNGHALRMSGSAASNGGEAAFHFAATSPAAVQRFFKRMTRRICSIGPLTPGPKRAQKVVALARARAEPDRGLRRLRNVDLNPHLQGFELRRAAEGTFVLLTRASCRWLGEDPRRQVIVRW